MHFTCVGALKWHPNSAAGIELIVEMGDERCMTTRNTHAGRVLMLEIYVAEMKRIFDDRSFLKVAVVGGDPNERELEYFTETNQITDVSFLEFHLMISI